MSGQSKEMVTVVYALGTGSHYKNAELRFSLRSVEKFLSNVANVVVVGVDAGFDVDHIYAKDNDAIPDNNIFDKIMLACKSDKVTDKFLFINDDHFILDYFNAAEFPYYYSGSLAHYLKFTKIRGSYWQRVVNVQKLFNDGKFFDVHTPILYEKSKFLELENVYDRKEGMVIKSLYCNQHNIKEGIEITDCKVTAPPTSMKGVKFISTFPHVKATTFRFLQDKFPLASRYE